MLVLSFRLSTDILSLQDSSQSSLWCVTAIPDNPHQLFQRNNYSFVDYNWSIVNSSRRDDTSVDNCAAKNNPVGIEYRWLLFGVVASHSGGS